MSWFGFVASLFDHRINHNLLKVVFFETKLDIFYIFKSNSMAKENVSVLPFHAGFDKLIILDILKFLYFGFDNGIATKRIDGFSLYLLFNLRFSFIIFFYLTTNICLWLEDLTSQYIRNIFMRAASLLTHFTCVLICEVGSCVIIQFSLFLQLLLSLWIVLKRQFIWNFLSMKDAVGALSLRSCILL